MARITVFEAGHCTHPGCVALRGGPWKRCVFPARAYLIEAGQGRWLWDTGYASHFHDHTRSGVFAWYRRVTPVAFEPPQAMAVQLRAQGLRPADLSGVVLSHFHADHIAGLRDFAGTRFICHGGGWQQVRRLNGIAALRQAFVPGLMPEDFETRVDFVERFVAMALPQALAPFTQAWALPGAGDEVLLVELPGHAAGHLGAFVHTDDGWVLLASDAAWSPRSYRERVGPSQLAHLIMDDARAYHRTLDHLHRLHLGGQARIWLTHEGDL